MKKSYSFIIITFLVMFFVSINNVNAEVYTGSITPDTILIPSTSYAGSFNVNINFPNKQGYLLFTGIYSSSESSLNSFRPLTEIFIVDHAGDQYNCNFQTASQYKDSNKMVVSFSAVCPIRTSSTANMIIELGFTRVAGTGGQGVNVDLSDGINFIEELTNPQDIVNAINSMSSTNALYIEHWGSTLWDKLQSSTDRVVAQQEIIETILNGMTTAQVNAINNNTTAVNNVNDSVKETNDTIKNDNVSGAESSADDLVNNSAFDDNTGLSGIISMPLTFVSSLSNTCQPISLTIPYMDYTFQVPCIQSIVNSYMPALVVVIKVIVNGLIIYWVMLDIFKIVKSAKNPDDDRIEVLDL